MKTYELQTRRIGARMRAIEEHPRYKEIDAEIIETWTKMCPNLQLAPHDYVNSGEEIIRRMEKEAKP